MFNLRIYLFSFNSWCFSSLLILWGLALGQHPAVWCVPHPALPGPQGFAGALRSHDAPWPAGGAEVGHSQGVSSKKNRKGEPHPSRYHVVLWISSIDVFIFFALIRFFFRFFLRVVSFGFDQKPWARRPWWPIPAWAVWRTSWRKIGCCAPPASGSPWGARLGMFGTRKKKKNIGTQDIVFFFIFGSRHFLDAKEERSMRLLESTWKWICSHEGGWLNSCNLWVYQTSSKWINSSVFSFSSSTFFFEKNINQNFPKSEPGSTLLQWTSSPLAMPWWPLCQRRPGPRSCRSAFASNLWAAWCRPRRRTWPWPGVAPRRRSCCRAKALDINCQWPSSRNSGLMVRDVLFALKQK